MIAVSNGSVTVGTVLMLFAFEEFQRDTTIVYIVEPKADTVTRWLGGVMVYRTHVTGNTTL